MKFIEETLVQKVIDSEDDVPVLWAAKFFVAVFCDDVRWVAVGTEPHRWFVRWVFSRKWVMDHERHVLHLMDSIIHAFNLQLDKVKSSMRPGSRIELLQDVFADFRSTMTVTCMKRMLGEWKATYDPKNPNAFNESV